MKHINVIEVAFGKSICTLNLSKVIDLEENENTIDQALLLKCFCESRKTQSFFTSCLNENSTPNERDFIISLIQESAKTSNLIKNFCDVATNSK